MTPVLKVVAYALLAAALYVGLSLGSSAPIGLIVFRAACIAGGTWMFVETASGIKKQQVPVWSRWGSGGVSKQTQPKLFLWFAFSNTLISLGLVFYGAFYL